MKRCVLFLLASTTLTVSNGLLAQGSLTPPGPPAPTMKTLSDVEPRIVVNSTNTPGDSSDTYIISQPGSYYLTTNINGVSSQNGITITANNVTLDLNGFALQCVATEKNGIYIPNNQTNVTVRNGCISGWNSGVDQQADAVNVVCERLNASSNNTGIFLAEGGEVRDCNTSENTDNGIFCGSANVSGCVANNNGFDGIEALLGNLLGCSAIDNGYDGIGGGANAVSGCISEYNLNQGIDCDGVNVVSGCSVVGNLGGGINFSETGGVVSGCVVNNNTVMGIFCFDAATVTGCAVMNNSGNGIQVGAGCVVKDCVASYNNTNGMIVGNDSTIQACTASDNLSNGVVAASECTIIGCAASANNGDGIQADYSCLIKDCTAASDSRYEQTGGSGIHVLASGNRIEGNVLNTDQIGIKADGSENVITRNTVRGSINVNYSIVSGNMVGTIVAASSSGAISGSTGGSGLGSTDPWANFSF